MQSGLEDRAMFANYGWVRWKFFVGASKNRRRVYMADFSSKWGPSNQMWGTAPLAESTKRF